MFLHQKLKYNVHFIDNVSALPEYFPDEEEPFIFFDTETTGLDQKFDRMFLMGFAIGKEIYLFEPDNGILNHFVELTKKAKYTVGHNVKFDYHMCLNEGFRIQNPADTKVLARLTSYVDDQGSLSLEALGGRYVDENAKFAGKVIKQHINEINRDRLKSVKKMLKEKGIPASQVNEYKKRVKFVDDDNEVYKLIAENYTEPNYKDVYDKFPALMLNYLADDIVITREYFLKAYPVLVKTQQEKIFKQESDLIKAVAELERAGLKADVDYLLQSRLRVMEYKDRKYQELWEITKEKITVGQHERIKDIFLKMFNIQLSKTDIETLEIISTTYEGTTNVVATGQAKKMAEIILELRTLEKWLNTYIEGKLNEVIDGRIYTSIDNAGTITGRVSSNMQQQPKEPLLDQEGNELFHPRKVFVNTEGYTTYYFDYSQMEMRLQAYYTLTVSDGDLNLCRAFVPYKAQNLISGETYDLKEHQDRIDEMWVLENGDLWSPTDLHTATTLQAFPGLTKDHKDFKHYRALGKMCNFLKNYGGGVNALKSSLKVDDEVANALDKGYYSAFPKIKDYQSWVTQSLGSKGFVENIYGRRYYISNYNDFYKGYNYPIQGGCADLLKEKEIKVYELLKDKKSRMVLVVHDELQIEIADGEEYLISEIKKILDDNKHIIDLIPMVCDVERTDTSWAEKYDIKEADYALKS